MQFISKLNHRSSVKIKISLIIVVIIVIIMGFSTVERGVQTSQYTALISLLFILPGITSNVRFLLNLFSLIFNVYLAHGSPIQSI